MFVWGLWKVFCIACIIYEIFIMNMVCDEQKRLVACYAEKFDKLILSGKEGEIDGIIREYNGNRSCCPVGAKVLNDLFFVWVGCIKSTALEYIDIWKGVIGAAGSIRIYYDSHFLLFNFYKAIFNLVCGVNAATAGSRVVELQGRFKSEIDRYVDEGHTFDQALILVVKKTHHAESLTLEKELDLARSYISGLSKSYCFIDVRKDFSLFYDDFFYKVYQQELMLRANAAAAVDVLRLLILYKYGGVYVDVDTLPSLTYVYGPLSSQASFNIQNIVRSEYFLRRCRKMNGPGGDLDFNIEQYEEYLDKKNRQLLLDIKKQALLWDGVLLARPVFMAHENLLSMAALETQYEYNNNILAAVKKSKLVRIALREIRRRYEFIFRHGFDVKPGGEGGVGHYLYRLSNYRYDTMNAKENVTLFLTGPILLLEVLLGVAYEVLSLKKTISPLALSYALRLDCIAIACNEHTCYTPEHMKSSWM
jgi:hypothetical protein